MTRYLSLLNFTDQGIRNVKDSPHRAGDFRAAVEQAGGKIVAQYWAIGEVDGCVIFEAPNEQAATGLLLQLGQKGNVRTRTMQVFDETEFLGLTSKL